MEKMQFEVQLDRLRRIYGKEKYPPERSEQIWSVFGEMGEESFRNVIGKAIGDSPVAPLITKLKEYGNTELTELHREKEERINAMIGENYCSQCRGTGIIQAMKSDEIHAFAFRCTNCDSWKIRKLSYLIPEYRQVSGWRVGVHATQSEIGEYRKKRGIKEKSSDPTPPKGFKKP